MAWALKESAQAVPAVPYRLKVARLKGAILALVALAQTLELVAQGSITNPRQSPLSMQSLAVVQ